MLRSLATLRTSGACFAASLLPMVCFLFIASPAEGQPIPAPKRDQPVELPAPRPLPPCAAAVAGDPQGNATVLPIDFATALRLVGTNNLDVAQAARSSLRVEFYSQRSELLMLPSVNAGSTYYGHEGNIAKNSGRQHRKSEQGFFFLSVSAHRSRSTWGGFLLP